MKHGLLSWGRYPALPQTPHACHWRQELAPRLAELAARHGSTLAFGNGRSYGDSCLAGSGQVLHTRPLDRLIAADWTTGRIVAEAGVTLEDVINQALPRGWFLPVTPGTRFVTLGGAVANDVHGKNHHVRGTFGRHVQRFRLIRSDREPLLCSPDQNADWFAATIGGLGLTGLIEWVELQLMPIAASDIEVRQFRFDGLDAFFALSKEHDAQHEYSVAWVDCLAQGSAAGRGVYVVGDHAAAGPLELDAGHRKRVPFTPPISAVNQLSLRLFNTAYFHLHEPAPTRLRTPYGPFFYPLDGLLEWNRIYGPEGFQQYQCVVPDAAARDAVAAMLQAIAEAGMGSFLAVLKRCGDVRSPGLLSFPLPGVSLALDFPQHALRNAVLFARLDAITREAGGRLYPAKDAHMSGDDFRHFYPAWERLEAMRDPALCSRFWQRVTQ